MLKCQAYLCLIQQTINRQQTTITLPATLNHQLSTINSPPNGPVPQRHAPAIIAMLARHGLSVAAIGRPLTLPPRRSPRELPLILDPAVYGVGRNHRLARLVAGTDVFSRQSDGTTIASQYEKLGITLRPANMERVPGWAEILHKLGDPAHNVPPKLFIHQRCTRLLECLPSLQHDPNQPEDILGVDPDEDGVGGDDAADALRYLVATKPRLIVERKLTGL